MAATDTAGERIVLTGGGTGGHVYPLLAIVESAEERGASIHGRLGAHVCAPYAWIGSERAESRIVPQFSTEYGIPVDFRQIDIRFSYRWPTPANWGYYARHLLPLALGRPFRQARALLEELQPALVLASGGYVSAPVLWAAQQLRIPYALLQLDAVPGIVNAHYCAGAARVYCSTQQAAKMLSARCAAGKLIVSGFPARMPRRSRREVFAEHGFEPARKLLVVMGGSLGAGTINRLVEELLVELSKSGVGKIHTHLAVLVVTGRADGFGPETNAGAQNPDRIQCRSVAYVDDSPSLLHSADFYLGRAGASTVAELLDAGIHALLIPDPQHADRQQYHNAQVLVARRQGEVLEQRQASGVAALQWLARVWDRPRIPAPDQRAADNIAADMLALLGETS